MLSTQSNRSLIRITVVFEASGSGHAFVGWAAVTRLLRWVRRVWLRRIRTGRWRSGGPRSALLHSAETTPYRTGPADPDELDNTTEIDGEQDHEIDPQAPTAGKTVRRGEERGEEQDVAEQDRS